MTHPIVQEALDWLEGQVQRGDALSSPDAVRSYLRLRLGPKPHEVFAVVFLNAHHQVIDIAELFRGTLTQTAVYPREVLIEALTRNAAAVILAHNHPSGAAQPSPADQALTRTLQQVLALVDVRVLDHFIVTRAGIYSFAEHGLL